MAAYDLISKFCHGDTDFGMALLEGFAGTGKTTLVGELVDRVQQDGMRVAIAAPTNKAVQVLRGKVQEQTGLVAHQTGEWDEGARRPIKKDLEYGSIHSFLGLKLTEREDGSHEIKSERAATLHEFDLVVIDECSMLADDLVQRISVSRRNARILFVGDPAQLPPVGGVEAVSPVFSRVSYRATLAEVVRQAAENPIIRLSVEIRKAIERGAKVSLIELAEALPTEFPAKAGLMQGGREAAITAALYEINEGRDARILAFRNATVLDYNAEIHERLHGSTRLPFCPGEKVIAHAAFAATRLDEDGESAGQAQVITSEELEVLAIEDGAHPIYRDREACRLTLLRDGGDRIRCYYAMDQEGIKRDIDALFRTWRERSTEAKGMERTGAPGAERIRKAGKEASNSAWALTKAYAQLRHAYAMTTHKAQGSTFDTAVVDLVDMDRMRSAFQFNRGLYVAVTRAAQNLALVV